jgi:hypothetical protein
MIGNETDAKLAKLMTQVSLAEGWEYIGMGSYRVSFLSPEGIVYKRQHYSDQGFGESDCNEREFELFQKVGESTDVEGFKLAPCHLWDNGVLAMPYITGGPRVWRASGIEPLCAKAADWLRKHEVYDFGGDNWLLDGVGTLWMVDYAQ